MGIDDEEREERRRLWRRRIQNIAVWVLSVILLVILAVNFWPKNSTLFGINESDEEESIAVDPDSPLLKMDSSKVWSAVIDLAYSPLSYKTVGEDTVFEIAHVLFYPHMPTIAADLYFKKVDPEFDGLVIILFDREKKNFSRKEKEEHETEREHVIVFSVHPISRQLFTAVENKFPNHAEAVAFLKKVKDELPFAWNWRVVAKPDEPKPSNLRYGLPVKRYEEASTSRSSSTNRSSKQQSPWRKTRTIRAAEPVSMSSCCSSGSSNDNRGTLPASAWRRNN